MYDYHHLVRYWFEEVWNKKRGEAIAELMAADGVGYGLGNKPEGVRGIEEFQELHRQFCGAFPDLQVDVRDVIVEGERSAARLTLTGTHQGDHLGIEATGRPVHFTGIVFVRWEGGKVVEGWNEFNFDSMMAQLKD
jgi:steroid delta-isomerase-like uncharacterized protein